MSNVFYKLASVIITAALGCAYATGVEEDPTSLKPVSPPAGGPAIRSYSVVPDATGKLVASPLTNEPARRMGKNDINLGDRGASSSEPSRPKEKPKKCQIQ